MRKIRRRNARTIAKLARAFAMIDDHARTARPKPKRVAKISFTA